MFYIYIYNQYVFYIYIYKIKYLKVSKLKAFTLPFYLCMANYNSARFFYIIFDIKINGGLRDKNDFGLSTNWKLVKNAKIQEVSILKSWICNLCILGEKKK